MLPPRVAFLIYMLIILQRRLCSGQGSMGDDNYGDTGAHTMDHTEYTCANCIIGKSIPFLCSECVSEQSQGQFTCGRCNLLREFFHCRRCRAKNPDFGDNFSVLWLWRYNFCQLLFSSSQKWITRIQNQEVLVQLMYALKCLVNFGKQRNIIFVDDLNGAIKYRHVSLNLIIKHIISRLAT